MADINDIIKYLLWAVGRCDRCRAKWADCKCLCATHRCPYKSCLCNPDKNEPEASEEKVVALAQADSVAYGL